MIENEKFLRDHEEISKIFLERDSSFREVNRGKKGRRKRKWWNGGESCRTKRGVEALQSWP